MGARRPRARAGEGRPDRIPGLPGLGQGAPGLLHARDVPGRCVETGMRGGQGAGAPGTGGRAWEGELRPPGLPPPPEAPSSSSPPGTRDLRPWAPCSPGWPRCLPPPTPGVPTARVASPCGRLSALRPPLGHGAPCVPRCVAGLPPRRGAPCLGALSPGSCRVPKLSHEPGTREPLCDTDTEAQDTDPQCPGLWSAT